MVYVIAQLSDAHVGGPHPGSAERFAAAVTEINAMGRQPDLVLLTGDNTHNGTVDEWQQVKRLLTTLHAPWVAINGNHDRGIAETAGHRSMQTGPLHLVLIDSSHDRFTADDAVWLDAALAARPDVPTAIAIHHPPFETGIWWMDCVGLEGKERVERVVRQHRHVIKILSGHVHRAINTNWDSCSLWVCPSTSIAVAGDVDPDHEPAETAEPPAFSLHAYTGTGFVSHVVPVGPTALRSPIAVHAAEFVDWARSLPAQRPSVFKESATAPE